MPCVRNQEEKHVSAKEGRKMSVRCQYHPIPKPRAKLSAKSVTPKVKRMQDGYRGIAAAKGEPYTSQDRG